jgi:hypothetical protein
MKKIDAYQGLDGQIYAEEGAVMEADEKWVIGKMEKELEALHAEKAAEVGGPVTRVFAVYRGRVREIFDRNERKLKSD